jgi:hypothetical protein
MAWGKLTYASVLNGVAARDWLPWMGKFLTMILMSSWAGPISYTRSRKLWRLQMIIDYLRSQRPKRYNLSKIASTVP